MSSEFEGLSSGLRAEARSIARKHWMNTHDTDRAKELASQEIQDKYRSIIATFLIALLIRLAIELIIYWFKKHILDPEPRYAFGEPGYTG
jgi:hypothetical protein